MDWLVLIYDVGSKRIMSIGFFDSGLGGLTVLAESYKAMPHQDYLYIADTLHVPYGTKQAEDVKKYVLDATSILAEQGIEALVVACNTATSIAIKELRQQYHFPVIGMEPAVKPALEMSRRAGLRVLVFGTPLTLKQPKYHMLVSSIDDESLVDSMPLPELVHYCESLVFDEDEMKQYFNNKLAGYDLNQYGTIVLGCTHYSYYRHILSQIVPTHIKIIDGNAGTVHRLSEVLGHPESHLSEHKGTVSLMCTNNDPEYIQKMHTAWKRLL